MRLKPRLEIPFERRIIGNAVIDDQAGQQNDDRKITNHCGGRRSVGGGHQVARPSGVWLNVRFKRHMNKRLLP